MAMALDLVCFSRTSFLFPPSHPHPHPHPHQSPPSHPIPSLRHGLFCSSARTALPSPLPPSPKPSRITFRPSFRNAVMENEVPSKHDAYTVGDFMTQKEELLTVEPSTTVDEALELLVENRITGLPVVDGHGKLVGVVSDYDLLSLDSISGTWKADTGIFPEPGSTWKAFKELQKLLSKTHGRTVGDVMTPSPLVVREMTNLEDAARLLLATKYRRLPVVDDTGKLVGLLTRGNVVRAALQMKQEENNISGAEK